MQAARLRWVVRASTLLLYGTLSISAAAQQITVSGTVRDPIGAVIPGAVVTLRSANSTQTAKTGPDGEFTFAVVPDSSGSVQVTAKGFAPTGQNWSANSDTVRLTFVLRGAARGEQILVSATRSQMKLSEVPGGAVRLSLEDVQANPAEASAGIFSFPPLQ